MPHDHPALVLIDWVGRDCDERGTRAAITKLVDARRAYPSRQNCDDEEAFHRPDTFKEGMDNQNASLHPVKWIPVLGPVVADRSRKQAIRSIRTTSGLT